MPYVFYKIIMFQSVFELLKLRFTQTAFKDLQNSIIRFSIKKLKVLEFNII